MAHVGDARALPGARSRGDAARLLAPIPITFRLPDMPEPEQDEEAGLRLYPLGGHAFAAASAHDAPLVAYGSIDGTVGWFELVASPSAG